MPFSLQQMPNNQATMADPRWNKEQTREWLHPDVHLAPLNLLWEMDAESPSRDCSPVPSWSSHLVSDWKLDSWFTCKELILPLMFGGGFAHH